MVSFEDIELFFALTCYSKHKYSIKIKEHFRGSLYYSLGGCTQFCKNFNFFEFFKNSPKVIETLNFASILNYLMPMGLKLSQTNYFTIRQYLGVVPHFWKINIFSLIVKKKNSNDDFYGQNLCFCVSWIDLKKIVINKKLMYLEIFQ